MFQLGQVVVITDKINGFRNYGTIKLIEPDNEIPGLVWLYIVANNPAFNTNIDPKIGEFWQIIEADSPYIQIVSQPVP